MKLLKYIKNLKATVTRSHSSAKRSPSIPTTPSSPLDDDNEENDIDYSPSIQQQTDGARLQKNERLMVKGMIAAQKRYLDDIKKWTTKYRGSFEQKEASFQAYETTLKLFSATISVGDQIAAQFDESLKELEKVVKKIPKQDQYPSVKFELEQARSNINRTERDLDALENKRIQLTNRLARIQTKLSNYALNTPEHNKLRMRQGSVQQELKELKQKIKTQKGTCQQANKQYRTDTGRIYAEGQKNELARLESLQDPLIGFVKALKIESISLEQAVHEHNPEKDLTLWKEKYYLSPFKQISV